jgi:hypothetical protein
VLVGGCAGQVAGLLEGGEISVDTPVMVEGMQGFAPLRDFVRMYGLEDELVLPHDGSWPPTQTLSFRLGFPYAAYVLGIGGGPPPKPCHFDWDFPMQRMFLESEGGRRVSTWLRSSASDRRARGGRAAAGGYRGRGAGLPQRHGLAQRCTPCERGLAAHTREPSQGVPALPPTTDLSVVAAAVAVPRRLHACMYVVCRCLCLS